MANYDEVMARLNNNIQIAEANKISFEERLRQKLEEARKKSSEPKDSVKVKEEKKEPSGDVEQEPDVIEWKALLTKLIEESTETPRFMTGRLRSEVGKKYGLVINFREKKCEVSSDLFHNPFVIVNDGNPAKNVVGSVWTISDFFKIIEIMRMFNGKIVLNSEGTK